MKGTKLQHSQFVVENNGLVSISNFKKNVASNENIDVFQ